MLDSLQTKNSSLELSKQHMKINLDDLTIELHTAQSNATTLEKKVRQIEKHANEWNTKYDEKNNELEKVYRESRENLHELVSTRAQLDETTRALSSQNMENKKLTSDINDLRDEVNGKITSCQDLESVVKRMADEKDELRKALEYAENKIQMTESKLAASQMDVANAKHEIERVCMEKEDEMKNMR